MAETFGAFIKERRKAQGLSQEQLADMSFMSRSMIAAIETDARLPNPTDTMALDKALGLGDVLQTFRPGRTAGQVAGWFERARQFEQQATIIREFALSYVPGILQTRAYATAVIDAGYPREGEDERYKGVVTRLERAQLLEDPVTPEVWALLDEAVIRRPTGGHAVMAEQLDHLAKLAECGRIRVHILPFGTVPHPLLDGMASLMWFEDQAPIVYAEGIRMGQVHESPALVGEIQGAYDLALSDALPLHPSIALIRAQAKEYRQHG
ncbi:Scr1 family TA system antitoxin-like transcriptional regulator [Streptomyces sp. NPDC088768]|uniref:helix-turn-helix domain-containing protein n=1 Tax=Streptomyces sp. NPDC088768 TaxID=3365894 RepID=UPI003829AA99